MEETVDHDVLRPAPGRESPDGRPVRTENDPVLLDRVFGRDEITVVRHEVTGRLDRRAARRPPARLRAGGQRGHHQRRAARRRPRADRALGIDRRRSWCTVTDSGPGIPEQFRRAARDARRRSRSAAGASGWRTSCATRSPWRPVRSGPLSVGLRMRALHTANDLVNGAARPPAERRMKRRGNVVPPVAAYRRIRRRLHWARARTTSSCDRLPLRPRRRAHADRPGPQRCVEADLRRVPRDVVRAARTAVRAVRLRPRLPPVRRRPAARRRGPHLPRLARHHPARGHARTTVPTRRPSTASATARTCSSCRRSRRARSRSTPARSTTCTRSRRPGCAAPSCRPAPTARTSWRRPASPTSSRCGWTASPPASEKPARQARARTRSCYGAKLLGVAPGELRRLRGRPGRRGRRPGGRLRHRDRRGPGRPGRRAAASTAPTSSCRTSPNSSTLGVSPQTSLFLSYERHHRDP